jgi:hypothetical protein
VQVWAATWLTGAKVRRRIMKLQSNALDGFRVVFMALSLIINIAKNNGLYDFTLVFIFHLPPSVASAKSQDEKYGLKYVI